MIANLDNLALTAEQVRRRVDPQSLPFNTTEDLAPLPGTIGQPRAVDAIEFGMDIEVPGYNLFVAGSPGSGRESTIEAFLNDFAPGQEIPPDWVYVHNFGKPDRPRAITLPAGMGSQLARDMEEFIQSAQRDIPRAFDSEDYEQRQQNALAEIHQRREQLNRTLHTFASEHGFALQMTQAGIATIPLKDGEPLPPEEFQQLPEATRKEYERNNQEIQRQISATVREIRQLEKEAMERMRALEREVALFAVGPLFDELRERYGEHEEVLTYLGEVQNDVPEHLSDFRPDQQRQQMPGFPGMPQAPSAEERLSRYQVNVFIDNSNLNGAPVIHERNPNYYNLIGRVNYRAAMGSMVTDFMQIRPGALHQANGGFLVVHALDLLSSPFAWEALKRCLICQEIQIENLGEQMSPMPSARLRPEAIPLSVKVVLIGTPYIYHLLYFRDEDFSELFKVKADFAPDMDWDDEHMENYAAFVRNQVDRYGLLHFRNDAVARVIEYGARLLDHQRKLSTRLLDISNVVAEASHWAKKDGATTVGSEHVARAIEKKQYRSNLAEERLKELYDDGTIMIDTHGMEAGQVNGLAVLGMGDHRFGKPSRITARVSLGQRGIQSIEREIKMSGQIHSKGVMTLSGYLAGKYAQNAPLAIGATITFEQSYSGIDGDSASSTELYALLSALSGLPLKQGIAVTGSVDQYGRVQAVGGVTDKVEGFFDTCVQQGLTGEQGVLIPVSNIKNLMLRDDVVDAIENEQFHVWAVSSIDEGITLLTGREAGEPDENGEYPQGSVHRLVHERLQEYAQRQRQFNRQLSSNGRNDTGTDDDDGDNDDEPGGDDNPPEEVRVAGKD
jgi:lon-related putative ATP-dependent protease